MEQPLVRLEHVSVARGEQEVLHDVSLELRAGEHLAILGPNGCGKSTLLKTLTCELYPIAKAETRVSLFGRARWDVTELRRRLGVVSAEAPPRATMEIPAIEAVLTGFFSSSRLWPNLMVTTGMRRRAEEVLAEVHGEHLAEKLVGHMSSGEQRKVMIARALAGSGGTQQLDTDRESEERRDPGAAMLLLDEPSNSLDLSAQRELYATLRRLALGGTTILLITHHVGDIIPEIGRVLLMKRGRIFREGTRREVLSSAALSELFGTALTVVERDGAMAAY